MGNKVLKELLEEYKFNIKGRLYHVTQIKFAYNSNHIEGSTLTEEQTSEIFTDRAVLSYGKESVNLNDAIEAKNHFLCFQYLLKSIDLELTESLIKEFHRILKTGTEDSEIEWFKVGDYKIKPNFVGGEKTASPKDVAQKMEKLLEWYEGAEKNFETIVEFHYKFERIHPFQDGNGRVGRLIMFRECLKNNIVPFIVDENLRSFYYRGLKNYEDEKGWLVDTLLTCQDNYKYLLDSLEIEY